MSQLPPKLLERLKRRGIIKRVGQDGTTQSKDQTSARPRSQITESKASNAPSKSAQSYGLEEDPDHEEIIAEDYSSEGSNHDEEESTRDCDISAHYDADNGDDNSTNDARTHLKADAADHENLDDSPPEGSVLGCPNKYNIYHECSKYCVEHYSQPDSLMPTIEQRKQLALVLRSYPLPNEWQIVYDPGVKTFYFWNIVTNLVSWFPPVMNGFVSISADSIRSSMLASSTME